VQHAGMIYIYDMTCSECSWFSISWQWSVNWTQIENKQPCTWEETINKTMQKHSTQKGKTYKTRKQTLNK
jgi:hypothetical protein